MRYVRHLVGELWNIQKKHILILKGLQISVFVCARQYNYI